ncbi:tobamovirus multiplication protein 1-like isoform x1 [Anaeramoeba flamelloides]|nr:tobamovirus multiplication protein 1-like isoform x1 [Anaeramoeba flamelloides]
MLKHVDEKNYHYGNFGFSIVIYLILSMISILFVGKVCTVINRFHINIHRKMKVKQTLSLILLLSFLYLAQSFYGLFSIIDENKLDSYTNKLFKENSGKYNIFIFFWFMFTEISPIFLIFIVFHQSLKRSKSILYTQISKQEQDMEYQQMNTSEEDLY